MHPHHEKATNGKGHNGRVHAPAPALPAMPPRAEREAAGRALRSRAPRADHARFEPHRGRDPLALVDATNEGRLADLVPVRWGRMFDSPFRFYRGAPAVMAFDLSHTPATGLRVQACGDAHLLNFGGFATPERNLIVDLNDFDETHPGPWEWDVKRLAASIVVSARDGGRTSDRAARGAAEGAVRAYREHMRLLAKQDPISVYYERVDATRAARELRQSRAVTKRMAERVARKTAETVPKLTELVGKQLRILTRPPIIQPLPPQLSDGVRRVFADYYKSLRDDRRMLLERFHIVDTALKVVGVGSVGTRCFIVLLEADGAPFFLQVKEAFPSVLAPYVGGARFDHQGRRVVMGQRMMQAASDIFLGWASNGPRDFYVRQFRDMKVGIDLDNLDTGRLTKLARLCGIILARAHARSGDAAAIGAYLGKSEAFDVAVAAFAVAYADQTERDHEALRAAVRIGKVPALVGT